MTENKTPEVLTLETRKAIQDSEQIHKRLQELLPQHPDGFPVKKSQLRDAFDIPATRAVKVWNRLFNMGYGISPTEIFVYPSAQIKEQKKQEAEQSQIADIKNELDTMLNDE